jgi:hypothetical protein
MLDVPERLLSGQRSEIAPDADALVELAQLGLRQLLLELWLPHEDDRSSFRVAVSRVERIRICSSAASLIC